MSNRYIKIEGCDRCEGNGSEPQDPQCVCSGCHGRGWVPVGVVIEPDLEKALRVFSDVYRGTPDEGVEIEIALTAALTAALYKATVAALGEDTDA